MKLICSECGAWTTTRDELEGRPDIGCPAKTRGTFRPPTGAEQRLHDAVAELQKDLAWQAREIERLETLDSGVRVVGLADLARAAS